MGLILATGAGALTGYVVAETIGGIGVAVVGTAFGMKTTQVVLGSAVLGVAAYGISQAVSDW